ncbi:MAG: 23S rRNA (guanosine(2251)-2'-O)-methyltransferase RlmB [Phycisphaerae bacterium]
MSRLAPVGSHLYSSLMAKLRKRKPKKPLLGSHQKCWLWGRNAVTETLQVGKWRILELLLADSLQADELDEAAQRALALDVPVKIEPPERLRRICHHPEHQGYVAKMAPFPYADADTLLSEPPPMPLYAVLDRIQDPQNFGAIVRSAEGFGLDALFISERQQVGVTAAVARASAGAVNRVPIARVEDLSALADRLKDAGAAIVGASAKAGTTVIECDFCRPTAILIGSESRGICPALLERCDLLVHIPQYGQIGSLNAAAAAAILFYEARRQRAARLDARG